MLTIHGNPLNMFSIANEAGTQNNLNELLSSLEARNNEVHIYGPYLNFNNGSCAVTIKGEANQAIYGGIIHYNNRWQIHT